MTGFDNIEHASLTDVGVRRSHNQDNHAILLAADEEHWRDQGHVFLVADGMGAHAVGELASELAVSIIPHTYHKHARQGASGALRKAFIEANASIHARGQANREFEGMGTTSTTLLLRSEGAWVGHVGDSRAYRIRGERIEQLSFDHSLVWEYARRQRIDPDGVQGIPSNVIVRSLGPEPLVQVDIEGPHPVQERDIYILCSDGLSGQVSDHELGAVASVLPPDEACKLLVDLANFRGGPDNITVIIVRVAGQPTGRPAAPGKPVVKKSWVPSMPWHLGALGLGALLAAAAVWLKIQEQSGNVACFLLAALFIILGLVGLLLHYSRERQRTEEEEEDRPEPKVYRQASCIVDRALVDNLARSVQVVKAQVEEKGWETNWNAFQSHLDLAEMLLQQADLSGSFQEYCRSLRILAEAIQKYRNKEEMFQPLWDRSAMRPGFNGPSTSSYRCDGCGKTRNVPKEEPTPACCDRPMTKTS